MWSDARGTPCPAAARPCPRLARSRRPPRRVCCRHGRVLVLVIAFAIFTYVSLSSSSIGGGRGSSSNSDVSNGAELRTPQNWGNDKPQLLLPSTQDAARHHIRQEPTLAPPPSPTPSASSLWRTWTRSPRTRAAKPQFMSYIMHATLKVTPGSASASDAYSVTFGEETKFTTSMNEAGRSFELNELAWFNGKLLAFDDRTGIVFRLKNFESPAPRSPCRKHEWATVKDGELYMGSVGKEFTDNSGNVISDGNLWVAVMDRAGDVRHEDWTAHFAAVRKALGCEWPGYVVHEAIEWSPSPSMTSFITVFDVDGNILMDETEIPGAKKYEGVAFARRS
ncbi:Soluble calcium-activated nucleotidase [Phytophthora cinnamomi]|uniref:Soluble calcium-activated nucleotidase n=1 Tax=Phytophthora cinnamomi TaxID=4785 RepID=UPI00355A1759|nr:Soluble calcium-activated nucleotidase [Phytophthora cinnamomi]